MLILDKTSLKARFFLFCLRNPMARGHVADGQHLKEPEWYIENGTTLCHFFWACLWAPLLVVALAAVPLSLLILMHVDAYEKYGVPGLFLPIGMVVGMVVTIGLIILAIIGAGKVGLLAYLKALKERVCPVLRFR